MKQIVPKSLLNLVKGIYCALRVELVGDLGYRI